MFYWVRNWNVDVTAELSVKVFARAGIITTCG